MPLQTATISGVLARPDLAAGAMRVHIKAATDGTRLAYPGTVIAGRVPVKIQPDGTATVTLAQIPQTGLTPADARWRIVFEVANTVDHWDFYLTGNTTWDQLVDVSGVPITTSLVKQAEAARDAARLASTRPASSMDVFGHSYTTTGAADSTGIFWQRFAADIGGDARAYGKFGARLIDDLGGATTGGYARALQELIPLGNSARSITTPSFAPTPGPLLAIWGYNDASDTTTASGANIAAISTAYLYAFRTVVSLSQASWRVTAADATITTLTGAWSQTSSQNNNVENLYKQTSTSGDKVTFTLPAGFKGGKVAVRMICNKSGGTIPASTVSCKVDTVLTAPIGFGSSSISTQLASTISPVQVPFRFNLAAGAHTIEITAGTGGMAFDGFHVEANPPRPVLWANIARTPAASSTVLSSIATLNTTVANAVSEFGSSVISIVDIDTALNNSAANFISDNVHPNDYGHNLITSAFLSAWRNFSFISPGDAIAGGRMALPSAQSWRGTSWYGSPGQQSTLLLPSNGAFYYCPIVVEVGRTFSGVGCWVTVVGNAGAILRMGLYNEDQNGSPGWLVGPADFGSVAADATGFRSITGLTLGPLMGRYWLGINVQSAATTRPTLVSVVTSPGPMGLVSSTANLQGGGFADTRSITAGTLPIAASPGTVGPVPLVALQA